MQLNWEEISKQLPTTPKQQVKLRCPVCDGIRSDKRDKSLSVNVQDKVWNCFYCGENGYDTNEVKKKDIPTFVMIKSHAENLSKETLDWFKQRGISADTINQFKIQEKNNEIHFNYYEDGVLVNIKYRSVAEKRFRLYPDAKLIAYNIDSINEDTDTLVITEGEIDALTVYEADNSLAVISVPNGANGLDWVDASYDKIKDIDRYILALDGDSKGQEYQKELSRRLGRHKCSYLSYPKGTKDLNEVIVSYGIDSVLECISNPVDYPIVGIYEKSDWKNNLWDIFVNGYDKGDTVGLGHFDNLLSFSTGQMTVISGVPSSGKSEFLDQIVLNLAMKKDVNKKEWKFGVISFENPVHLHISKLVKKYLHKPFDKQYIHEEEIIEAVNFIDSKFKFFNVSEADMTIEGILDTSKELVARYGITSLVIDPYNYIESKMEKGQSETNYISDVLTQVLNFAKEYSVHVFFVAHPTKIQKDETTGNFKLPSLYSISGSANWYNKTDNGIIVWRNFQTDEIEVRVQKVRFAWNGKVGLARFKYNKETGEFKADYLNPC